MSDHDEQRHRQIEEPHKRHEDLCDPGDLFASAKDADCKDHSQDQPNDHRCGGLVEKAVSPEGVGDVKRSYQVESAHVGQDQEKRRKRRRSSAFSERPGCSTRDRRRNFRPQHGRL